MNWSSNWIYALLAYKWVLFSFIAYKLLPYQDGQFLAQKQPYASVCAWVKHKFGLLGREMCAQSFSYIVSASLDQDTK